MSFPNDRDYFQCVRLYNGNIVCKSIFDDNTTAVDNTMLLSFHKQMPTFLRKLQVFNAFKPYRIYMH